MRKTAGTAQARRIEPEAGEMSLGCLHRLEPRSDQLFDRRGRLSGRATVLIAESVVDSRLRTAPLEVGAENSIRTERLRVVRIDAFPPQNIAQMIGECLLNEPVFAVDGGQRHRILNRCRGSRRFAIRFSRPRSL